MLVAEKDSAGHLKVSYTNGKGEVISRTTWTTNGTTGVTSPESTIFFLYDGSGNVNVVLDEQGTVLKRLDYDVFGAERDTGYDSGANNSNAESNRMKFSGTVGHVGEPDLGLIYMRARYYDPALGRFISEDMSRNGANWYVCCDDDPVNRVDPTGCDGELIAAMVGSGIASSLMSFYSAFLTSGDVTKTLTSAGIAGAAGALAPLGLGWCVGGAVTATFAQSMLAGYDAKTSAKRAAASGVLALIAGGLAGNDDELTAFDLKLAFGVGQFDAEAIIDAFMIGSYEWGKN